MAKKHIVANWKMNPLSQKEAQQLFSKVKKGVMKAKYEVVVCPPFVYLSMLKGLSLGAQNASDQDKGALTGEVAAKMLKDLGVKFVIVGHSERRRLFAENGETINKKLKSVCDTGLKPILCVGETEGTNKSEIIETQLSEALSSIPSGKVKSMIIAYEPVWAIGTGKNCSVDETISSILLIKSIISKIYNRDVANSIKVLYGGSVNGQNASSYLNESVVDGLLVGGASLNAEEFINIVKAVQLR